MTHSNAAAAAACGTALTRLGGELADRGCQSELLPGGSAPWLLISNPAVRHCGAVVVAWKHSFWWPWGAEISAIGDPTGAADVVAASLTTRRPAHEVGGRG
jgi:hypothetical protein